MSGLLYTLLSTSLLLSFDNTYFLEAERSDILMYMYLRFQAFAGGTV